MRNILYITFAFMLSSCGNSKEPISPSAPPVTQTVTAPSVQVTEPRCEAPLKPDVVCPTASSCVQKTSVLEVRFSPKGQCQDIIIKYIKSAKKRVLLQAYGFTSEPIISALTEMAKKVDVILVLDGSNAKNERIRVLGNSATILIDSKHKIAHNKVIVVDDDKIETGSFNYSESAETSNAENCIWIQDLELAKKYNANFELHRAHSKPFGLAKQ